MNNKRLVSQLDLWSGDSITAYPLDEDREYGYFPEDEADPSGLDTAGHFLSIRKKPVPAPFIEEQLRQEKLFTDNAFLFLVNRERIIRDERLYYVKVELPYELTYIGGFSPITLGEYVSWWHECPWTVHFDNHDSMSLVWFVSGGLGLYDGRCLGQFYLRVKKFQDAEDDRCKKAERQAAEYKRRWYKAVFRLKKDEALQLYNEYISDYRRIEAFKEKSSPTLADARERHGLELNMILNITRGIPKLFPEFVEKRFSTDIDVDGIVAALNDFMENEHLC